MRAAAAGAATGERSQSVNRRVFQNDVRKDAHLLLHCGERKVLIALDHSAETAGILLGEEARIYGEEKVGAENRSSKGRSENQQLAAKNPPQGNIVNVNQSVKGTLKESVDPVVASGLVFQKRAHIMGVVVRETKRETPMATLKTTANSRKRRPTMPGIMRMGINTATRDVLMERTVKPISLAPLMAAGNGFIPFSM